MSRNTPGHRTPIQLARQIGSAAREARLRLSLTQADVAERIGVATEVYGRLERGELIPRVVTLCKVCRALRLDASVALGLSRDAQPTHEEAPSAEARYSPLERRIVRNLRQLPARLQRLIALVVVALSKKARHLRAVVRLMRLLQKAPPLR